MRTAAVALFATAIGLLAAIDVALPGQPPKDPHKGWVEYDDLDQTERLKERPGNFPALAAIADFFEGAYSVRPDYSRCAYPLQLDAASYESWDDVQKEFDRRAADNRQPKNKLRQYNFQIRSLAFHSADDFPESDAFNRLPDFQQQLLSEVRLRHPGRALVVLVEGELESLQSPKVESTKGLRPNILYLVYKEQRWQVAWYDT